MKKVVFQTICVCALTLASAQMSFASGLSSGCAASAFSSFPQEASAREAATQSSTSDVMKTSVAREAEIAKRAKIMEDEILGVTPQETPVIQFFAEEGTGVKVLHTNFSGNEHNNEPNSFAISGIGSGGVLKGTLLLPVSGHTGTANALAWAKTDTYTIQRQESADASGKSWPTRETNLVTNAKSLGLITYQEIEIQLSKDHMVQIFYVRSGSGGVGGYPEGRTIQFVWDGT